jgi:hypothetical protein
VKCWMRGKGGPDRAEPLEPGSALCLGTLLSLGAGTTGQKSRAVGTMDSVPEEAAGVRSNNN